MESERSKDAAHWRARAQASDQEVARLKGELSVWQRTLNALKVAHGDVVRDALNLRERVLQLEDLRMQGIDARIETLNARALAHDASLALEERDRGRALLKVMQRRAGFWRALASDGDRETPSANGPELEAWVRHMLEGPAMARDIEIYAAVELAEAEASVRHQAELATRRQAQEAIDAAG